MLKKLNHHKELCEVIIIHEEYCLHKTAKYIDVRSKIPCNNVATLLYNVLQWRRS
jgi:hypothetical protein